MRGLFREAAGVVSMTVGEDYTSVRVFISHAHQDHEFAKRLAGDLGRLGYEVWTPDSLEAGENWVKAIGTALREASAFIALITDDYNRSANTASELAAVLALDEGGRRARAILPVIIEPGVRAPPFLSQFMWIDASKPDNYPNLLSSIQRALTDRGERPRTAELAQYEEALPGAADRILQMAELEAAHRLVESEFLRSTAIGRYGAWLAITSSLTALAATGAILSGSSGILPSLAAFIAGVAATAAGVATTEILANRKERSREVRK